MFVLHGSFSSGCEIRFWDWRRVLRPFRPYHHYGRFGVFVTTHLLGRLASTLGKADFGIFADE